MVLGRKALPSINDRKIEDLSNVEISERYEIRKSRGWVNKNNSKRGQT